MFSVLIEEAPDGQRYLDWLLSGLGWTMVLASIGWCIAFVLGVVVGAGRTSPSRLVSIPCRLYTEFFRNIPVLIQMFVWYFVIPEFLPFGIGDYVKQIPPPWGAFYPALACLSLYTSARVAEQVRAGIEALPKGQREAASALSLSTFGVYRYVLVPQALRMIMPSLTSEVMGIFKNTSVALTIGLLELTAQARQVSEATFETFGAFATATLIYLALALLTFAVMSAIERTVRIPGQDAPTAARGVRRIVLAQEPKP